MSTSISRYADGVKCYSRINGTVEEICIPKIILKTTELYQVLKAHDIVYISKYGSFSKIHYTNRTTWLLSSSINSLFKKLSSFSFFKRINTNLIVNEQYISAIRQDEYQELILDTGEEFVFNNDCLSKLLNNHKLV
ncbi:MAG: LytTR family transcriptional regulator DNA-binding domain-containing protein [Saprospiraceae bacterium]